MTNPQRLAQAGLLAGRALDSVAPDLPNPYPARYNAAPSQPVLAVLESDQEVLQLERGAA